MTGFNFCLGFPILWCCFRALQRAPSRLRPQPRANAPATAAYVVPGSCGSCIIVEIMRASSPLLCAMQFVGEFERPLGTRCTRLHASDHGRARDGLTCDCCETMIAHANVSYERGRGARTARRHRYRRRDRFRTRDGAETPYYTMTVSATNDSLDRGFNPASPS
jgi:hypothetical protein